MENPFKRHNESNQLTDRIAQKEAELKALVDAGASQDEQGAAAAELQALVARKNKEDQQTAAAVSSL